MRDRTSREDPCGLAPFESDRLRHGLSELGDFTSCRYPSGVDPEDRGLADAVGRFFVLRAKELLRPRTEFLCVGSLWCFRVFFFRSCSLQDAAVLGPVSCLTVQGGIPEPDSDCRLHYVSYSNISRDSRQKSRASPVDSSSPNTPFKYSVFLLCTHESKHIKHCPSSSILLSTAPRFSTQLSPTQLRKQNQQQR